jgi:hypothetical protein
MQAIMHSQQAWHMAQQSSSPLVQVMHTPILVSVHSHLHIDMLHWHISMPFIMQQQLHRLPAIILHIFCKVVAASSSSHVQVIFMPPLHFSIFIVQRGTMHICMEEGATPGIAPACMPEPIEPIIALSIIMTLAINLTPFVADKELRIPYLEYGRSRPTCPSASGDPVSGPITSCLKRLPVRRVGTCCLAKEYSGHAQIRNPGACKK